jgi:hypothetical protein
MTDSPTPPLPDAQLLLAPGCAHCPAVLDGLAQLLKQGKLGRLEVVNVAAHPGAAAAAGTRSVPWCRIGPFELEGAHPPGELAEWARHAAEGTGMPAYLAMLLESRKLNRVIDLVHESPQRLRDLVLLAADLATPMAVRIGVGAVFEEFADAEALAAVIPDLAALTRAGEPQVRADACHYLGLSGSAHARPHVAALVDDPDAEVRQIAAESLALLPTPR